MLCGALATPTATAAPALLPRDPRGLGSGCGGGTRDLHPLGTAALAGGLAAAVAFGRRRDDHLAASRRAAGHATPIASPFPLSRFVEEGIPASARFLWWEYERRRLGPRASGAGRRIRAGLNRLKLDEGWLEVDASEMYMGKMTERREVLRDHPTYVHVSDGASRGAEAELAGLVVDHLTEQFPDRFRCSGQGPERCVESVEEGLRWRLADWEEAPLLLSGQLVQEDICLMREESTAEGVARHVFVAGLVTDSFDPVEKHGLGMGSLHGPVPGYAEHLDETMGRVFSSLRQPMWRANFSVLEWQGDDEASTSEDDLLERLYLKVEYETLRRLPRHREHLVFTIREHVDQLAAFAAAPVACAALATEVRNLPLAVLRYRGLGPEAKQRAVLRFLDDVCRRQGLEPAPATGELEPWERSE